MAYGESNAHVTDGVTWPLKSRPWPSYFWGVVLINATFLRWSKVSEVGPWDYAPPSFFYIFDPGRYTVPNNDSESRRVWRSIQHNNTTPLSRFLFFCNFTTGPMGSNMFCWISQNFHIFFAETFCEDSTAIALSCELEHIGASRWNLAPFGPPKWPTILATNTPTTPTTPSVKQSVTANEFITRVLHKDMY